MHDTKKQDNSISANIARLPKDAQDIVASMTKGLTIVTCLRVDSSTAITVSKDGEGAYHVTTYFTLGARWVPSHDAQGVTADEAFAKLAIRMN